MIEPLGGKWGAITVVPFHNQRSSVQYLHCSSISVKNNQLVAPWTVLGRTGTKAPPESGVTGYHLHLHVINPGVPRRPTWPLNYVDPTTWPIRNPLIGQWSAKRTIPRHGYTREKTETWTFLDDAEGARVVYESASEDRIHGSTCVYRSEHQFIGKITSRRGNYLGIRFPKGQCSISTNCDKHIPCTANGSSGKVRLINSQTLRVIGNVEFDLKKDKVQSLDNIASLLGPASVESGETAIFSAEDSPFPKSSESDIDQILAHRNVSMDGYRLSDIQNSRKES